MSKTMLTLTMAAVVLPLLAFEAPAVAASAHNLQAGTSTTNPHDSRRTARMKQMRRMHRRY